MNRQQALKILGLNSDASIEEIKSTYRIEAKKFHPDRFCHDSLLREKAESRMKEINLAFYILANSPEQKNEIYKQDKGTKKKHSNKNNNTRKKEHDKKHQWKSKTDTTQNAKKAHLRQNKESNVFNIFFGFIKKTQIKQKRCDKAEEKQNTQSYEKNQNNGYTASSNSSGRFKKTKKLKKFDSILKKNLEEDIIPSLMAIDSNIGHISSIRHSYTRIRNNTRRIKHLKNKIKMPGPIQPVQKISPVSPIKKIR